MKVSRVVVAGVLAVTLYGSCALPQIALGDKTDAVESESSAAASSLVTANFVEGSCEKQEVVYAAMSTTGAVKSLYVVNELFSEVPVMVRDYGAYRETLNLTDESALVRDADSVAFGIEEESFVYQGNLSSTELPWNTDISYYLDGKSVSAADLAGKSGELKIVIETTQNGAVDPLYFDNYLLQISCTLPMEHVKNIEAEEGTIALAGSNTTVSFNAMPGKDGSFSLTAQVSDFEMEGISIAAVPFSMAIDVPDSEALVEQFDALIEGAEKLDQGAVRLADGARSLDSGAQRLDGGADALQDGSSELSAGLSLYVSSVAQVNEALEQVAAGSGLFAKTLDDLRVTSEGVNASLDETEEKVTVLIGTIDKVMPDGEEKDAILSQVAALSADLTSLRAYVDGVSSLSGEYGAIDDSLKQLSGGLGELEKQGEALSSGSTELDAGVSELANSTSGFTQGATQLADGATQLAEGTDQLSAETKGIPDKLQAEIDAMMADYDKSDFVPQSFVDARNTNVKLVQFVMTTEAITVPDPEPEEVEPEDESFLSRFFALFS